MVKRSDRGKTTRSEDNAKANTSTAIKKLMGLQPKTVLKINTDGTEQNIPIAKVNINDVLLVKPGDKIPVDGIVNSGSSAIDESSITGESIPADKHQGDKVFAGTINQKGSLQIVAQKVGDQTVLSQIIKMVQEAQRSKAPVQKLVDKIARCVCTECDCLCYSYFYCVDDFRWRKRIHARSTFHDYSACDCLTLRFGLATPTAIMVGIGKGAEHGILIKDAESLEQNKNIDTIILDKTGTITEGKPTVTDLIWKENSDVTQNAAILFSIEQQSEHPLADAVTKHLTASQTTSISFEKFESITGKGVAAVKNQKTYLVGNKTLLLDKGVVISGQDQNTIDQLLNQAKTVILFAEEKTLIAILAISDKIKTSSASAIQQFKDLGIEV